MDADDVCLPNRLEIQYKFMEENVDIGLIGGAYQIYDSYEKIFRETDYEAIKLYLLRFCYLHHPTCIIRAEIIKKYNLFYNETYTYASDYDLQVRVSSLFPVGNINEPVLIYREHDLQISSCKRVEQLFFANQVRIKQLSFFGIEPNETEKSLHLNFIRGIINSNIDEHAVDLWINKLLEGNRKTRHYSGQKLQDFLFAHRFQYLNKKNN